METTKLIKEYLEAKGIDTENIDLSDFGQFLENSQFAIFDKINKQYLD